MKIFEIAITPKIEYPGIPKDAKLYYLVAANNAAEATKKTKEGYGKKAFIMERPNMILNFDK